jgi:dihydroxyacetone kinase-like protein
MLRSAAALIRANQDLLSKLDSFGGDGDHGTTMARAMGNLEQAIDKCASRDLKTLLYDIGWAIMGTDGGATGPLFGTFFMGMSSGAEDKQSLDAAGLAAAFEAGLAGVQKQSKAKAGDKTMLDALIPAVAAAKQAAAAGGDVVAVLQQAAEAAVKGAEATTNFQARFGRAKTLGPKSIGHPDAGATSVSLLFKGFSEGLK